jgi:hypothetical protein
MRQCPFCREEVRDDAIKCRYCASSLLIAQLPSEGVATGAGQENNKVVYIVDKGLIAFAKFALAMLAIFATIGAALYGFDIQHALTRSASRRI